MTIKLFELVGEDINRPFSPHVWKVRMALAHKELEFERIPTTFTQVSKIDDGTTKTVPVILYGENKIVDSFNIALYLRDTYPDKGGRLFYGEGGVSMSRFVEAWSQSQFHPWITKWALMDIHQMLGTKDRKYFRKNREDRFGKSLEEVVTDREQRIPELENILTPLRVMLKRQNFIGGNKPVFADYIIFGAFQWLRVCSGLHMIKKDDSFRDWIERMLDLHDGAARVVREANS